MGRLANLGSSPLIREYAQGIARDTVTMVGNFLAPTVNVGAAIGKYKLYTEKNRFRLPDTIRPAHGKAVRLAWDASDANYNCTPNAVDVVFDLQEIDESDQAGEDAMKEAADMAASVGTLSHERDVITAALASVGAGTDVNVNATDPVDAIDEKIDSVALESAGGAITNVRVLFGPLAWRRFKNCSAVRSRFVAAGSKAIPNIGLIEASSLFTGNPEIQVARAALDTTPEGQTASMAYLMTNSVLIFCAAPNPNRRDPSFMKTFRLAGRWLGPRTYTTEDGRSEVAGYDWSHAVKVTNSLAGTRLNFTSTGP